MTCLIISLKKQQSKKKKKKNPKRVSACISYVNAYHDTFNWVTSNVNEKRKRKEKPKLRLELQTLSKILIPEHKYFYLLKKSPFSPIIFPTE